MTKQGMLGAVTSGTRTVMRFINVNGTEISRTTGGALGPTDNANRRTRTRSYKRRDNKFRRKQSECVHPYVKFNAVSPAPSNTAPSIDSHDAPVTVSRVGIPGDAGQQRLFPRLLGQNGLDHCNSERRLTCSSAIWVRPDIFCDTQTQCTPSTYELSDYEKSAIVDLLLDEMSFQPNVNFLYNVDPMIDDKVDANLRNEAIFKLRFLHNGFFFLSPDTFCKAVNLMDRFIVKVKVKPKYTSCVATACYYIASKLNEPGDSAPSADTLVQISRCGGTATDLNRMEDIIRTKLGDQVDSLTALDFIRAFLVTNATGGAPIPLSPGLTTRLLIALCSLEVYQFRPSCLALAVLLQEGGLKTNLPLSKLEALAKFSNIDWTEVEDCADVVQELYESYYRRPLPSSRDQLVWTLSRRTLSRMVSSTPTPLDTISEDISECIEECDDLLLDLLFEE